MIKTFIKVFVFIIICLILLIIGGLLSFNKNVNQLETKLNIDQIPILKTTISEKSAIYIIGTDHIEGEHFNSDSILYALCRIQPDVIALESDSSFFDEKFRLKFPAIFKLAVAYGKAKLENEPKALINYKKIDKHVELRPFDISNRNEFHRKNKLYSKSKSARKEIEEYFSQEKLSISNTLTWKNWLSTNKEYINLWRNHNSPSELNNNPAIDICRRRQLLQYDSINNIIQTENLLKRHREFYQLNQDFWHLRNKTMVENIVKISNEFVNKKIVILTGASHKYYLLDELNKIPNKNFEILEFYQ